MKSGTLNVVPSSSAPPVSWSPPSDSPLHYVAFGDCGGSWNPGHCAADPVNLSLVQRTLGYGAENTKAYMMRGLNYDDLASTNGARERPLFELWEALTEGNVYPRKVRHV